MVKICHITRFMCTPYLEKLKTAFCRDSWNVAMYNWLQLCQILTDFNIFAVTKPEKCTKQGTHLLIYYLKVSLANDVINVSLFACCEPRHRPVEASSVGLSRRWMRTFWTLFIIATLKITTSNWQHCKFDYWRWLFVFSIAENVNEQRIIYSVFNWKVLLVNFTK